MSTDLSPRESHPSEPFEMTKQLARELVRETGIDGVGVAVFATESTRDLVYASDRVAEEIDETQFTLGEGPCLDAFRFERPELHADMAGGEARARWPLFTAQVLGLGAASVYAYPLGGGGAPFGVLELYGSSPIALAPSEDVKCRSYAHTIAHAVVAELAPAYALTSGVMSGCSGVGTSTSRAGYLLRTTGFRWTRQWCVCVRGRFRGNTASPRSPGTSSPGIVSTRAIDSVGHHLIGVQRR